MATRKAIALVSGLFQEINTPTDGLDFAGNMPEPGVQSPLRILVATVPLHITQALV